jgi:hypothetical protein
MLNQTIEDELGKGECSHPSTPFILTDAVTSTTRGASAGAIPSEDRSGALLINHAHEEQMGMGEHPGVRD